MSVLTLEGVVENGQIKLSTKMRLPEKKKVFVIIPDFETKKVTHVYSPRFANPEDVVDFKKKVVEVLPDAKI